jgi:hypothetical protein
MKIYIKKLLMEDIQTDDLIITLSFLESRLIMPGYAQTKNMNVLEETRSCFSTSSVAPTN